MRSKSEVHNINGHIFQCLKETGLNQCVNMALEFKLRVKYNGRFEIGQVCARVFVIKLHFQRGGLKGGVTQRRAP